LKKYRFSNPIRKDGEISSKSIRENMKKCLDFTYQMLGKSFPRHISLFDMFKLIREYVNYYGTGATRFLYGTAVKNALKKGLPYITFYFLVMVENYMIAHIGCTEVKRLWEDFKDAMVTNFGISFSEQQKRFDAYYSFF
jgi:hypothetical protein